MFDFVHRTLVSRMQRRSLLTFLGIWVALPASATARSITRVIVRDEAFKVVREISSAADLARFAEHWSTGTLSPDRPIKFDHKIDVQYGGRSERWLYSAEGYARALSKKKASTYRVSVVECFGTG